MKFIDKKQKLEYLLQLIKSEHTGNPTQLAQRIYVSRRTLFRYFDDLSDMGLTISYCFKRGTYYFIGGIEKPPFTNTIWNNGTRVPFSDTVLN